MAIDVTNKYDRKQTNDYWIEFTEEKEVVLLKSKLRESDKMKKGCV